MGLLQNNAYGNELALFCLIIPCAHCLFLFYFYKKCKWPILVLRFASDFTFANLLFWCIILGFM